MEIQELEGLVQEFYESAITNERRYEIQYKLKELGSKPNVIRWALGYIASDGASELVGMQALTVVEDLIKRWALLNRNDKEEVRRALSDASRKSTSAAYLRNKVIKLIVDLAKFDWPAEDPDYLDTILNMTSDPQSMLLGLIFLQTTVEEFSSNRENITFERKRDLIKHFSGYLPRILTLFKGILETGSKNPHFPPIFDPLTKQILTLVFRCLNQLVIWNSSLLWIDQDLVDLVFRFVRVKENKDLEATCGRYAVAFEAMSVINEIIAKPYADNASSLVAHVIISGFSILEEMLHPNKLGELALSEIDEGYLSRFIDFVQNFVQSHLTRCLYSPGFNVESFFFLLFRLTDEQTATDAFIACLDIWQIILEIFSLKLQEAKMNKEGLLDRFEPVFLAVSDMLLKKIQYDYNSEQIDAIFDVAVDNDSENVWQIYLKTIIEILYDIAVLYYSKVIPIVESLFTSVCKKYMLIHENYFVHVPYSTALSLKPLSEEDISSLISLTHDLTGFLQVIGRFSDLFCSVDTYTERKVTALRIFNKMLEVADFGSRAKLYKPFGIISSLKIPVIDLYGEKISSIQVWFHWLCYCQNDPEVNIDHLLSSYINICVSVLSPTTPAEITTASARSIVSATLLLRSQTIAESPQMAKLFTEFKGLKDNHLLAYSFVASSLFNILVLPWFRVPPEEQKWESRKQQLGVLMHTICSDIEFVRTPDFTQNDVLLRKEGSNVQKTFHIVGKLLSETHSEANKVKPIIYEAIQPYIADAKNLLKAYGRIGELNVVEDLIVFFVQCFDTLQHQMGYNTCCDIIETLLEFLSGFPFNQSTEFNSFIEGRGSAILDLVLTVVGFAVKGASKDYKKLLPSILSLCMDNIYPAIFQRNGPEVKVQLLKVMTLILLYHWKFFFTSTGELSNEDYFYKIMAAFGQAFLQSDVQVFKDSLEALLMLNSKCNLFHKEVFLTRMRSQFMTVLLQILIAKTHDLLRDEITQALFELASVDFDDLFNSFLPQFASSLVGISDHQKSELVASFKQEKDFPTFALNLERFVVDSRCFFIQQF
ncbi:exportin-6-like isoform X1 [Artemia franciscana]|uniref:exportin-6-like isoform X1 n=1 Tax=Artemia franciscana TaxID=6661 RepID=UPI0032D9FF15